jgi:hypothetical protein
MAQTLTFPEDLRNDSNRYGNNRLCINIYKNNMVVDENVTSTVFDAAGNVVSDIAVPKQSLAANRSNKLYSDVEYTIFLPTPLSLNTNYAVNYTDVSVTDLGASIVSSAASGAANIAGGILGKRNPLVGAAVAGLPKFLSSLPIKEAATFGGLETGLAINPHQELLLNGVKFREFKFVYNLIAKSKPESDIIKDIIKALKISMHPELAVSSLLFKYPSEFELLFYTTDSKENPYLFKTKRCILKNLDVSYGKNFVTFKDTNAPVEIELSMNFQETEILTRETIESQEGTTY